MNHTLAVSVDGNIVWAFGDGDYGKLGLGNTAAETKPVVVTKLNDVGIKKIAAGTHFSVALSKSGVVYSWGQGKAVCNVMYMYDVRSMVCSTITTSSYHNGVIGVQF